MRKIIWMIRQWLRLRNHQPGWTGIKTNYVPATDDSWQANATKWAISDKARKDAANGLHQTT